MAEVSLHSNVVASSMIKQIINKFQLELIAEQTKNKLPSTLTSTIKEINFSNLGSFHLRKPNNFANFQRQEDLMPTYPPKQCTLLTKIPIIKRELLQLSQTTNGFTDYRRKSSTARYSSANDAQQIKRSIKINVGDIKADKVIRIDDRSQVTTAKSFRSVIELQEQIKSLRSTYLKNLREKVKLNVTCETQNAKKIKKNPKQFTYDYNFQIINRDSQIEKRSLVKSALKAKSISQGILAKKVTNNGLKLEEDSNLQQQLARISTGLVQKEAKGYNNYNKRQVSHFPFISLAEDTKLIENQNILHGPLSPRSSKSISNQKQTKRFKSYFLPKSSHENIYSQLITENVQQVTFPSKSKKIDQSNLDGSIRKNPRYYKSKQQPSQQIINSNNQQPKERFVDRYYKLKAKNNI